MTNFLWGMVVALAIVGIMVITNNKDESLMGVGTCVESNAYLEGFQGTSKEKWEVFAEYCKSEIRREN